jgi:sulfoxide reductase heme-binding subunit YedZ
LNNDHPGGGQGRKAGQGARILLLTLLTAVLTGAVVAASGTGPDGTRTALRVTARFSLIWFLLAYVAGPLDRLRPGGLGAVLRRHRREFGVVFGLSMTMHVGFILRLYGLFSPERPPTVTDADFWIGIPGLMLVAAMTATSAASLRRALGERRWSLLHRTGLHAVWAVFFLCLVDSSARKETAHFLLHYGVFLAGLVGAAALRLVSVRAVRYVR